MRDLLKHRVGGRVDASGLRLSRHGPTLFAGWFCISTAPPWPEPTTPDGNHVGVFANGLSGAEHSEWHHDAAPPAEGVHLIIRTDPLPWISSMDIEFGTRLPPFTSSFVDEVATLSSLVFEQTSMDYLTWRLTHMPDVSAFSATSDDQLIGFKIGYAMSGARYYSWLGGVHPEFRRRGVASELMVRQHRWLRERGYSLVETAANQENHAMAQTNLRHGFSVCGIRSDTERTQILFSKDLRP